MVAPPRAYFVYVGSGRHVWRFVFLARHATDGADAIRQAWAEAIEMGETPTGSYMACAAKDITTRSTGTPA